MFKKSLMLAGFVLAVAGPALAQPMAMPEPGAGQRQTPFERADANNDGVITLDEVRAVRTAAFNRLDVNKDGYLVQSEMPPPPQGRRGGDMQEVVVGNAPKPARGRGGEMLGRADANRDGNVTRAEFDAMVGQMQPRRGNSANAGQAGEMFDRIDANRDGVITRAEAEAFRAANQGRRPGAGKMAGTDQAQPPAMEERRLGQQMPNPDTDNDQRVSLAEWLARPDPLFERGDANKDGRVTREEAANFVRDGRGQSRRPGRPW